MNRGRKREISKQKIGIEFRISDVCVEYIFHLCNFLKLHVYFPLCDFLLKFRIFPEFLQMFLPLLF